MNRTITTAITGLFLLSPARQATAAGNRGCARDTECKGDRICENGRCVNPPPKKTRPTPKKLKKTGFFRDGYGTLSGILVTGTWGKLNTSFPGMPSWKLRSKVVGGIRVSGHKILHKVFHLGAFAQYLTGEHDFGSLVDNPSTDNLHAVSVGLTAKAGVRLIRRLWLGAAADVGFTIQHWLVERDTSRFTGTAFGVTVFPRVLMDVALLQRKRVTFGCHVSTGLLIDPYLKGKAEHPGLGKFNFTQWTLRPVIVLGLILES